MKHLFKKLKIMTGCTYEQLAVSNYCTKQYIHILLTRPNKKNNLRLAKSMSIHIENIIEVERANFEKRMESLKGLATEINEELSRLSEEETA